MPNKIKLLSEETINKIAAGEVIENPASVIKELIENSLDASATSICIEIQQGGRQLIRITDDGCGMSKEDALLSLKRHATSKILQVEDIEELHTMGFRGEALPSVASISHLTMITNCFQEEAQGVLIKAKAGEITTTGTAAHQRGTTIEIKDLFFNVPVRKKFQKSPSFDVQAITKMVRLLALGNPNIHFHLISDQKSLFKTAAQSSNHFADQLRQRIAELLGKEFAAELLALHFDHPPYQMVGFLGSPALTKPSRSHQFLFINQRLVTSTMISSSIREGYGTMLQTLRYPAFILHLYLPGSFIDVNVHPQKKEVRLRQEWKLKEKLMEAVQLALRQASYQKEPTLKTLLDAPMPFFKEIESDYVQEESWQYETNKSSFVPLPSSYPSFAPSFSCDQESKEVFSPPSFLIDKANPQALFTVEGFIIVEATEDLFTKLRQEDKQAICLLSQKNGYARLFYDRFNDTKEQVGVQNLLVPLTMNFSLLETEVIHLHLNLLNQMGFSIREFGMQTFLVDSYPELIKEKEVASAIQQIICDLTSFCHSNQLKQIRKEELAAIACRQAMRLRGKLSLAEAQLLIDQLFKSSQPFQSPKGDPIFAFIPFQALAKFFEK